MSIRCVGCMEQIDENLDICPVCGYRKNAKKEAEFCMAPGTLLYNKYFIGKVLGIGGFGITYLGWDQVLNRKVAIKEYFPSELATREVRENKLTVYPKTRFLFQRGLEGFVEEGKRLAKLAHVPQIVGIYDCLLENGTGYLVMEYLHGRTVKQLLKEEGHIPVGKALYVADEVLCGLEQVHKAGIIHRDIAPDNILIEENQQVRLLDFGSARFTSSKADKSLSILLKPGYAPEEQYRIQGEQGPWTDVYGMGASLYRMISGKRPQPSVERLLKDEVISLSKMGISIKKGTDQAIMHALGIKKENRYQTAGEFRLALKNSEEQDQKTNWKLPVCLTIMDCILAAVWFLIL